MHEAYEIPLPLFLAFTQSFLIYYFDFPATGYMLPAPLYLPATGYRLLAPALRLLEDDPRIERHSPLFHDQKRIDVQLLNLGEVVDQA
jgi:hypothetical protein